MHRATNVAEVEEAVKSLPKVIVRAGGTKSAMSAEAVLSLDGLSGIREYEPAEYTFTALAGTRVSEVRELLARNGQYLPFDPVLVDSGATIGGTIASGLSGPGRFRYGGVRDFLLGVKFVTGEGILVSGGGKVVKNAAGFDFPKLFVGSRGELGILVEATFKVFPQPRTFTTLRVSGIDPVSAVELMDRLSTSPSELACLDYVPPGQGEARLSRNDAKTQSNHGGMLLLRIGGLAESMPLRIERTSQFVGGEVEVLTGEDDANLWRDAREFGWHNEAETTLVKLPITPDQVRDVEHALEAMEFPPLPRGEGPPADRGHRAAAGNEPADRGHRAAAGNGRVSRRYSVGGNVCWLSWPNSLGPERLSDLATHLGRATLAVRGQPWDLGGSRPGRAFLARLTSVLDPSGKFQRL